MDYGSDKEGISTTALQDEFVIHTQFIPVKRYGNFVIKEDVKCEPPAVAPKQQGKSSVKDCLTYVFKTFIHNTTVHGFGYVKCFYHAKHYATAAFFAVITLIFAGAAITVCVGSTNKTFFNGHVDSTIKWRLPKDGMKMPKLTMCSSGFFNITAAESVGLGQELRSYLAVSLLGLDNVSPDFIEDIERQKLLHERYQDFMKNFRSTKALLFKIAWTCETVIEKCIFGLVTLNATVCCKIFKPVITNYGVCYESNLDATFKQNLEGSRMGLWIVAKATALMELQDGSETIVNGEFLPPAGLIISVMNKVTSSRKGMNDEAIPLQRGKITSLALHYTRVNNLPASTGPWPWSTPTCVPDDSSLTKLAKTRSNCLSEVLGEMLSTTNCSNFLMIGVASTQGKGKFCTLADQLELLKNISKMTLPDMRRDFSSCELACTEEHFHSKITMNDIGRLVKDRENKTILHIYYPSFLYKEVEQSKPTFGDWISVLGGQMGLFLGASLISVMELIYVAAYLLGVMFPRYIGNCLFH